MKNLICIGIILCLFSNIVYADNCDWTQIKKLQDGGYEYNPQLNLCVGQLVQQNKIQAQQIQDYQKAIELKDLAIKYDDERVALWSKTAGDEQDRLLKMDSIQRHNDILYFALGIATTFVAAYTASRIYR